MFKLLLKSWSEYRRFSSKDRDIVFYAEDAASWVHFEPILQELTGRFGKKVSYLTSSSTDPILETRNANIESFYIGEGIVRTYLFMVLKARLMVMTVPDLETLQIKKSKLSPVHYVYVFHSLVSTHMVYRKDAFDHFDTIFCVGPHHKEEIRRAEKIYGLKAKKLVEHGYGRLDRILKNARSGANVASSPHVLLAPSWGDKALLEICGEKLIEVLLEAGFDVTVRPHPMTLKSWKNGIESLRKKFDSNPHFHFESDIRSEESLHSANLLITDWSGAALEFAFGLRKPVLFIDVPRKVNNPAYEEIGIDPVEVSLREKLGGVVAVEKLSELPEKVHALCRNREGMTAELEKVRGKTVFNVGRSGTEGATHLFALLEEPSQERKAQ